MDIREAVDILEKFLEGCREFPLYGLGDDTFEAIEMLVEYTKK